MRRLFAALLLACGLVPLAMAADLQVDLLAIEKGLWTAWGKKDGAPFKTALAVDAVQIVAGTAPIVGRDAVVQVVTTLPCELKRFAFQDARLRKLGTDVVALSYVATQDATCEGKKLPPKIQSTSIYVQQKGKWLQTHYQETPLD